MKQVLNEELFRIQEIMGIKKTSINENLQSEQNNLISEQPGAIADLIQGAANVGADFERTSMNVIDDVISRETNVLSKVKGSKIPSGGYNTLEELSQAIAKKEIPDAVVEAISATLMKKIIATPEGAKLVAKSWAQENLGTKLKQYVTKIESGGNLPNKLIIKTSDDFDNLISKISTGDANVDTQLKAGLEDLYGKPLKQAKANAEDAITKAKAVDAQYQNVRDNVSKKINDDPALSKKKFADWFGHFEDKTRKIIETDGELKAREYLFNQLQKKSIWGRIQGMFSSEGWYKTLEYVRKKGVTMSLNLASMIMIGGLVYWAMSSKEAIEDTITQEKYLKIQKFYPVTQNASKEILNHFISSVPREIDALLTAQSGYSLRYQSIENSPIGPIEELKIETPSNTYEYTLKKETGLIDEKITPKVAPIVPAGGGNNNTDINQLETFKTFIITSWGTSINGSETYKIEGDKYIVNDGSLDFIYNFDGSTFNYQN